MSSRLICEFDKFKKTYAQLSNEELFELLDKVGIILEDIDKPTDIISVKSIMNVHPVLDEQLNNSEVNDNNISDSILLCA